MTLIKQQYNINKQISLRRKNTNYINKFHM